MLLISAVTSSPDLPDGVYFDMNLWGLSGIPRAESEAKHYEMALVCNGKVRLPFSPVPYFRACFANVTSKYLEWCH